MVPALHGNQTTSFIGCYNLCFSLPLEVSQSGVEKIMRISPPPTVL